MKKTIGYGLAIWILMFVIISVFVAFKVANALWASLLFALIGGVIAFVLAGKINLVSYGSAIWYGLVWVVVGIVLDYLISTKFAPAIFSSWTYWLGYALVLAAPASRVKKMAGM